MNFGTTKTTLTDGNTSISDVAKYHNGAVVHKLRTYRVKVKVLSAQDEMTEFIRFTDELAKLRQKHRLGIDPEDQATQPTFSIRYPKYDVDGSYFVIKCWTEII